MKFYMYGGCEIHDTIPWLKSAMPQHEFIQQGTTTLGSMFSKHGRIADMVFEWYNSYNDPSFSKYARKVYREIVSKDHLRNIYDTINKKDSYIIISLAYEAEARFNRQEEHITLIKELIDKPGNNNIKALRHLGFPEKAIKQINDPRYTVSWNDEEVKDAYWKGRSYEWLPKFGDMVHDLFGNKVIMLYTPPARKWYNKKHGIYHQLPTLGQSISAYWHKKDGKFWDNHNWQEVDHGYQGMYMAFRRWYPGRTQMIKMRWEDVIGDDHHRMNRAPYHYTEDTVARIGNNIQKHIQKVDNENSK